MNRIKLETPHYKIKISFNLNTVVINCKEATSSREYDLPCINVVDFEFDSVTGYLYIFFEDKTFYQIKLESENEIVIDHFHNNGELISEVGAWDFFD